jgi:hypothetical protein
MGNGIGQAQRRQPLGRRSPPYWIRVIVTSAPASASLEAACQLTETSRIHLKESSNGTHEAILQTAEGSVEIAIPLALNSEDN